MFLDPRYIKDAGEKGIKEHELGFDHHYHTLAVTPEVVIFVVIGDIAPRVVIIIAGGAAGVGDTSVVEGEGTD